MIKFIKMEDDDKIAVMIKRIADEFQLSRYIDIQPRYLTKAPKNNVGALYKWNDVSATLTNNDSVVIVAVYGEAFDRVDEPTQEFWLRNLMSQITYDFDKDKIVLSKELLTVPVWMYQKYGIEAINKKELEIQVLNVLAEEAEERKKAEKEAKKASKKRNN